MKQKNANRQWTIFQRFLLGLPVLGLVACTGVVEPPATGVEPPGAGAQPPGAQIGSPDAGVAPGVTPGVAPSSDAGVPTLTACVNASAGAPFPVPLQRLNTAQYQSIVSELFGPTITMQNAFPAPLTGYPYTTYSGANPMGEGQTQAVLEAAESVAMQVADIVPACTSVAAETSCATSYLTALTSRAFRRPATSDELKVVLGTYSRARVTVSYQESVAVAVETILQMPQFLYVLETQPTTALSPPTVLTGAELAQRMALLYWNGLPDKLLLDAAQSGALADPNNRFAQAQRMMLDPRASAVFSDFLRQWMTIKGFKADVHAPDLQVALDEEMRRDIDYALSIDNGLQELVASNRTYMNSVLEKFYGVPAKSTGPSDWHQVDVTSAQRVGILTSPILLAKFAHGQIPSPILRGKFVRMMLMCDDIAPPPPGALATQDTLTPVGASIREQSQARLQSSTCGGCHTMMDPIGFSFSAFDGTGKYVPSVAGQPVDTAGHIASGSDLGGDFNGVRQLGDKLARSPKVQACMAAQWLRYSFGVKETNADQCAVAALTVRFSQKNNSLLSLFAGLSALDSFAKRSALPEITP
jgi:Protein of unknown function (DUF1588)/Protein of unknown function (DUF1592)/Protein of unknown function (DUF1595)/Protein of unknown function (DUF1585)/Protein of unknown function (DUF1587)